jgi:cytochrome c-type biogenesis protein CcmH
MSRTTRLWISWGALAVVAVVALSYGALAQQGPSTNQERVYEIAATLRCPQCVGQSVAESDVAIAREIRTEIAVLIADGLSDEEIRTVIAGGYDGDIRYNPSASGVTGLVWLIPVVVGVGATAMLVLAFRRWGARPPAKASAADRELVSAALAGTISSEEGLAPGERSVDDVGEGHGR